MEKLFLHVLDLSIAASWVILAVLAVRILLRKAPKVYSYALWAVVGFRLISSASISSVVSLFNLRPFKEAAQTTGELQFVSQDIESAVIPPLNTGVPSADGLPEWEPYTRENGATMLLDTQSQMVYHHDRELQQMLNQGYNW